MTNAQLTFDEVRQARAVVTRLARETYKESGPSDPLFAGLVEAKRTLGIVISEHWAERLAEVLEEQG